MRKEVLKSNQRLIIRKCHVCGQMVEANTEQQSCGSCGKSFLPLNYFAKVHNHEQTKYNDLFAQGHELNDEDLVKGLFVLW